MNNPNNSIFEQYATYAIKIVACSTGIPAKVLENGVQQKSQRPKCPRCWNKQPAKKTCGYCGGQGRV